MDIIRLTPLKIVVTDNDLLRRALNQQRPDEEFNFAENRDLLTYLSEDIDRRGWLQRAIDGELSASPVVKRWNKLRTKFSELPHFTRYRRRDYDQYHAAARAKARNCATEEQIELVDGLTEEIDRSQVLLSKGQSLFHGRADPDLAAQVPYPSFISTSLNPIVAVNSSFRRKCQGQEHCVYILTLEVDLPALWGHYRNSVEWELLLPPLLEVRETSRYQESHFTVVEALIVARH